MAYTSVFAPFTEIKPEESKRVTEVSYLGFVYGTKVALGKMLPRDRGTIVQVGSALGYRSIPLQSAYCGAKHAINGFSVQLWAAHRVVTAGSAITRAVGALRGGRGRQPDKRPPS